MRLMLLHPDIPSCDECQEWFYDSDTWKRTPWRGNWLPRGNAPTPCWKCPKCPAGESPTPETGKQSELNDRNAKTLDLYYQAKTPGCVSPEALSDPIVRRNFRILNQQFDMLQPALTARALTSALVPLLIGKR